MHRCNSVLIHAPPQAIFDAASDLLAWPQRLPHYRYVREIGTTARGALVEMAATRTGIPIAWVSEYWADPHTLELHFIHQRKWTRGMVVVWKLTPTPAGTRVEIVHDLRFRIPALGWLAEPIIGGFFISHIANKTLATFKQQLEAQP